MHPELRASGGWEIPGECLGWACVSRGTPTGAYAGRPGPLGATREAVPVADRASSSSVLQAKPVLTPRSRASPVTLAGGSIANGSGTTTDWAGGPASVSVSAEATCGRPVAVARVVATARTARRRGVELVWSRLFSRRPPSRADCSAARSCGERAGGSRRSVLRKILICVLLDSGRTGGGLVVCRAYRPGGPHLHCQRRG